MTNFSSHPSLARELDAADELAAFRERFHIPHHTGGGDSIYLCGNSLGLQPKSTAAYVEQELLDWEVLAVEGHEKARHPWMPYHEFLTEQAAQLVGAKPGEVVTMNSLTVNLHLLMVSFYRPTAFRHKILVEANPFPSDRFAACSQIAFHGYDPADALLELPLRDGENTHRTDDIIEFINNHGSKIALILLGGVNYYTGQAFDMQRITEAGHANGCTVGFDLAHAAGNLELNLHEWGPDFAAWCSYKYLNSGPGSIAGCFIHERHEDWNKGPRFAGWWGHDKETRFLMGPEYIPMKGAEGWQLSNPPILPLAALRASLDIFGEAGMEALRRKSEHLTAYMAFLIDELGPDKIRYLTPSDPSQRGCQLSLVLPAKGKEVYKTLTNSGVICDWREPDVIRVAPVPLYNTFTDVYNFVKIIDQALG